jgi:hypothetical protein
MASQYQRLRHGQVTLLCEHPPPDPCRRLPGAAQACPIEGHYVETDNNERCRSRSGTPCRPESDHSVLIPRLSNVWSKLVIIEGIMGSGKSTTTLSIAHRLEASGIPAIGITEGVDPHPIRFDWDVPWSEMPPEELAKSCIAKWRSYVDNSLAAERISIVDGQLFRSEVRNG